MIELRPYQIRAIAELKAEIRSGRRRVLLQLPTGAGKTLTAASILAGALAKGSRSLFLAHRVELIDQTVTAFDRLGITRTAVIRSNDKRRDASQPIQIASVQTLVRRPVPQADIVIVDEAHRATAAGYQTILSALPNAIVIGLTATPIRSDGKPLGTTFDSMVCGARYSELIEGGHLAEPLVYRAPPVDLSGVHTVAGDYNPAELEEAVNKGAIIGDIIDEWARHQDGHRTVVFAVSIAHSLALRDQFRARGFKAEHVDGATPLSERRGILARLASGDTQVVCNVGVLCEGWDLPSCKRLVLARPTKSLGLYMQMAGRILRPWEGVPPIILDHGGNYERHGAPHEDREWSLDAKTDRPNLAPSKCCKACFAFIPSGSRECPLCGTECAIVSIPAEEKKIEHMTGVALVLADLKGDDAQLKLFRALSEEAQKKGWKPGAVNYRFEQRFGHLPPKEWFHKLRRASKKDEQWAAMMAAREAGQ